MENVDQKSGPQLCSLAEGLTLFFLGVSRLWNIILFHFGIRMQLN